MKNKFVKNLYQIISFSTVVLAVAILLVVPLFYCDNYIETMIFLSVLIGWVLIWILAGFYWTFQIVEINGQGIKCYFFKKEILTLTWEDVVGVNKANVMRNNCITLYLQNHKKHQLNLDDRKSIMNALKYYGNEDINNYLKNISIH